MSSSLPPTARPRAWLVDDRWAKAYPLGDATSIGRGVQNEIILRDPAVSRKHAEVTRQGETFLLCVQGATGTKVNGLPVAADCALAEGDVIEIAFSTLRFTTRPPTSELSVISHDTPTPLDTDGPTRSTIRAVNRAAIIGHPEHVWRRMWRWLTRRRNTE